MHVPADENTNHRHAVAKGVTRRALPGRTIDLIRDGVRSDDIRDRGHDPAVWSALISTAMSAVNRQWSATDFISLVLEPRSHLGAQAALKKGNTRGARQTMELIHQAWRKAEENVARTPAWTTADMIRASQRSTSRVGHTLEDLQMSEAERLVLLHVTRRLMERGSTETAISRRDFIDSTGLGQTALETAQRRLMAKGQLVRVEAGRPSGPNARRRRANVWALAGPRGGEKVPRPHSSNTGNRYVASALRSGAPAQPAPADPVGDSVALTPAEVDALFNLLVTVVGTEALAQRLELGCAPC